jgi:hypothetical protein
VTLHSGLGRVEVIVPPGLSVDIDADVSGPGHLELFGDERGGVGISDVVRHEAAAGSPELDLELDVSVGEIQVHQEGL